MVCKFVVWLFVIPCLLFPAPGRSGELRVGRAAVDITPPPGMPMGGYFLVRLNTGTHDPLHAKAIVLEANGVKAAVVTCDLVEITKPFVEAARRLIEQQSGLRGENVMISATHTHTGPEMSHVFLDHIQGAPSEVAKQFRASLPSKIAEAVHRAELDLKPARASVAVEREPSLVFNRRFIMSDGSVQFNPGKMNPRVVRPAGPVDPELPVVYFETLSSEPLATYVNYALHLDTTGGTQFSADYPFTLSKILGDVKGTAMLTVFTIGTAGNINHVNVKSSENQTSYGEAARIGTVLAGDVLRAYGQLKPVSGQLRVRRTVVELLPQQASADEAAKANARIAALTSNGEKATDSSGDNFLEVVDAFKKVYVSEYGGKPVQAEVMVIAIGDELAWVGLPGEIFVELGEAIKLASPFPTTIIAELAGDSPDYIPDRKAFAEGAYEVVTARFKPGCGEQLVDGATRLLVETYQQH